jgi:hypothetical protein
MYIRSKKERRLSNSFLYDKRHIELLYYCALDTPLPDFYIKSGCITPHNNDANTKTFAENCIKTSTFFINFLFFQHDQEQKRLKQKGKFNMTDFF